ncbi:amino acid adenylation domain-containing protein [Pedobacter psychrodurus]|uniref:Amino acid adenylation domain-containing protein n=1 Tax=Pedobacter psychrodurus TaxID=2530456 RepID=A0A4R0PTS5_9SPHI|nr:polyketide synthase [Pedobacter psychrodurus]TCD23397.1 amino acid adenylation domain-containing protein [Pedobacter psychrodurus]
MLNKTLSALITVQCNVSPDNIALEYNNQSLAYGELDTRSNQLANFLTEKGIDTNSRVPILLNRSFEMIIAILAIMKCGASYVPIDPLYPMERVSYIIEDIEANFLITSLKTPPDFAGTVILLDGNSFPVDVAPKTPLPVNTDVEAVSYIIYTSGSTGKPKGVVVQNKAVSSFITNQSNYYGITAEDRILLFSSISFDASVEQIFIALTTGACLVLLPEELLADMEGFTKYVSDKKITHLDVTPGFLENLDPEKYTTLKRIVVGGDVCPKALFLKWQSKGDFYNVYGPTEATVTATAFRCSVDQISLSESLPIGKPLTGTEIYILDEAKQMVAGGKVGEIYLTGMQLAKGYLNNPTLTAQNFIKIGSLGNHLFYKTGDMGKWLADGNIEYIGRVDEQVKIRGYRIEIGEIENALNESSLISQSVVLVKSNTDSDKQLIAFIVSGTSFKKTDIEDYLSARLPEYMVPRIWVELEQMPLTVSGKIDKKSLVIPDYSDLLANPYVAPRTALETRIAAIWKNVLAVKRIGTHDNFFDLGGNSLLSQRLIIAMDMQDIKIPVVKLYQYPTVSGLANYLTKALESTRLKRHSNGNNSRDIAVIGMAGRFPGAETIAELWNILAQGRETTTFFSNEDLDVNIPEQIRKDPLYIKARGIIDNPKMFDPDFFGINRKLAELMDPQHRIFLEIAFEVLEKTGHLPSKVDYKTGVFAGCGPNFYYENNVLAHPDKIETMGKLQVTTVNDKDYIASRTAYHLNLKGPAININSACSTSLLAILEAVNSLRAMQCDIALAGGASINASINSGHIYQEGSILSKDGHCRPFDDESTGTVFSDGAGVVLLKRLEDAQADGDTIYAVIKGVGVSNDGYDKASFTAPSTDGQADAVLSAIVDADIETTEITYIETHGTGTPIGDPIEFEGLVQAFGNQSNNQYCAIGSIKSNFGHLTEAAGVASFIKTCLSLYHKKLVPSIGFNTPNKNIDFDNSPFYVNNHLQAWTDQKRVAGVSSFGVGGTNVHVILEGYENNIKTTNISREYELIPISAKSVESLTSYRSQLKNYVSLHPETLAEDMGFSLQNSRGVFNHRGFIVVDTKEHLANQLANNNPDAFSINHLTKKANDLIFMFPGQGSQYHNMGYGLYQQEPVYREAIDECSDILKEFITVDLRDLLFSSGQETESLQNTRYAQPAIFATEYAMAKLWMSFGCKPDVLCGHSIGEYVAAHLSGIFSLADALKLVALRGKMISELPAGGMLSIRVKNLDLISILPTDLSIAAKNTNNLYVIAGPVESLSTFKTKLDGLGIPSKFLSASHAFHSSMMDPVIPAFREFVSTIALSSPKIPLISTVTGVLLEDKDALNIDYWADHLRKTVKFSTAVEHIATAYDPMFLEVGPGDTLSIFIRQILLEQPVSASVIPGIKQGDSETRQIIHSLGRLFQEGQEINWEEYYKNQQRGFLELPSYCFDRKKYWVEPVQGNLAHQVITIHNDTTMDTDQKEIQKRMFITKVKTVLENSSGIEFEGVDINKNFLEIGFDSLLLTQVASSLKKEFNVPITFRQLNEECSSINALTDYISKFITPQQPLAEPQQNFSVPGVQHQSQDHTALSLLSAQLELIAKQIQLLTNLPQPVQNITPLVPAEAPEKVNKHVNVALGELTQDEQKEIRKPFGATPKIEFTKTELDDKQRLFLAELTQRYNSKTAKSKNYTIESRPYMADPRVVNGFKPTLKDLIYPVVVKQSEGSKLWDLDDNEYIDALNGFGSNMLGYQPQFIKEALHNQIEKGFEVGPQHELAAEVSKLICEFTGFERTGLCSTGSEAVMGCIRLARTVTARSIIVAFSGSYHGIFDEVLVRGTKKLKSFPAAAGIMPEAVENILILDYGTDETLEIIKQRANEIAGVLVEPVQSRRPEFVPIAFLAELREITHKHSIALIFDEVITGFRMHPGGAQAQFGIKADLASYGKVVGSGIPIGVIAGNRKFMDALDGGSWNYGDTSIPEVGITYFAGTFVRHPLALAAAKASLLYMKEQGPALQQSLNEKGNFIAQALEREIAVRQLPIKIANYGSLWKIKFEQDIPYSELLFVLMREKGIHILDGFPCFMTEATTYDDISKIISAFNSSIDELIIAGFFPNLRNQETIVPKSQTTAVVIDTNTPPIAGARLGKDRYGNPAWFLEDPQNDKKFLQIQL